MKPAKPLPAPEGEPQRQATVFYHAFPPGATRRFEAMGESLDMRIKRSNLLAMLKNLFGKIPDEDYNNLYLKLWQARTMGRLNEVCADIEKVYREIRPNGKHSLVWFRRGRRLRVADEKENG